MCDMDCLHCKFSDCINDSDVLTYEERKFSRMIENSVKKSREPRVDMTRYIHNRIDKEEYIKPEIGNMSRRDNIRTVLREENRKRDSTRITGKKNLLIRNLIMLNIRKRLKQDRKHIMKLTEKK